MVNSARRLVSFWPILSCLNRPAEKIFRVFKLRESDPPHDILSDHLPYFLSKSELSTLEEMVLDLVDAETIEQIEAVLAKYGN